MTYAEASQLRRVPAALRRARRNAGLSIFDVARLTGKTATAVALYESARCYENRSPSEGPARLPPIAYVYRLAAALRVSVSELLP